MENRRIYTEEEKVLSWVRREGEEGKRQGKIYVEEKVRKTVKGKKSIC